MAIYHFSAKVISRANGSSAVASAAYRSAERLHDDRLDRKHDFTNKSGVVHSEVMLPDSAPERLGDRSTLWNEVEAGEVREDAQLSREVEFAMCLKQEILELRPSRLHRLAQAKTSIRVAPDGAAIEPPLHFQSRNILH
jgi:MobA/MobL family